MMIKEFVIYPVQLLTFIIQPEPFGIAKFMITALEIHRRLIGS